MISCVQSAKENPQLLLGPWAEGMVLGGLLEQPPARLGSGLEPLSPGCGHVAVTALRSLPGAPRAAGSLEPWGKAEPQAESQLPLILQIRWWIGIWKS